jgi:choline dehydrogenase-like flavoprotein
MSLFPFGASFLNLTRDRGEGRVTIDDAGQAVSHYPLTDELDIAHIRRGLEELIRMHDAAGALEIQALSKRTPVWRRGDDLDEFIGRVAAVSMAPRELGLFGAHPMGTCRMGADPASSVAGPWGELHDTPGVWIGDASAFPTASGTNPMFSVMSLARRTAHAIAAA